MPEEQTIDELHEEIQRLREQVQNHNGHPSEKKEEPPAERPKKPLKQRARGFVRRHPVGIAVGAIALVAIIIGGIFLLRYFHSYESTDDAFVEGHLNPITPRIGGTVIAVHVENNQFVHAGEVLVELDPRDYQVALQQARASFSQAASQIQAANPNVPITQTSTQTTISTGQADIVAAQAGVAAGQQEYEARLADLKQAEAQNAKAQTDAARYESLVRKDEVSRQQYDTAVAAAKSQAAAVEASKAAAEAARRALDQRRAQLLQAQTRLSEAQANAPRQLAVSRADLGTRQANAQAAQAQVAQAELNLSYTTIVAPVNGVVTNRTVEVGQHLQPGEAMLSVSQVDDLWITANFKETQLQRMRPGQECKVHVDAFDATFDGYVEWMPGASGAATSLLPPENATGNFVKVVQRLPVRIRLKAGQDPEHRLRIGMSVEPKVWL
jgi:membrane fusion protein (multidrug efflux system)